MFVSQTRERLSDLVKESAYVDAYYEINAGKFRRLHGAGFYQHFLPKTLWLNTRDFFRAAVGFVQSLRLLRKERPAAILIKGGFVGVPMGLAAALLKVRFITHDSDVLPGLANRIVGKWAQKHAVSFQETADKYYRDNKSVLTGAIVGQEYKPLSKVGQGVLKEELGFPADKPLILVTGGGLGAQRLNQAFISCVKPFLVEGVSVVHLTGKGFGDAIGERYEQFDKYRSQIHIEEFSIELYRLSGAADLVVTRAGATALAEFANQKKPCVVVPNPMLTGGHQSLNAAELEKQHAAIIVYEKPLDSLGIRLGGAIREMLGHPEQRKKLAEAFYNSIQHRDAAERIASLLLEES